MSCNLSPLKGRTPEIVRDIGPHPYFPWSIFSTDTSALRGLCNWGTRLSFQCVTSGCAARVMKTPCQYS